MDISNINGISTGDIKSFFNNTSLTKTDKTDSFSDVLSAAMGSIGETNDLQNAAEQEEVRFALFRVTKLISLHPVYPITAHHIRAAFLTS